MGARHAAERCEPSSHVFPTSSVEAVPAGRARVLAVVPWAIAASTLHRIYRGEGALLAVNASLIVIGTTDLRRWALQAAVSILTMALMYALNDLWDAPTDANNPKKVRALIDAYLRHRAAAVATIVVGKVATLALAWTQLGPAATAAVGAVMVVNLAYSTLLKGVPVIDVVWCGLWGALYAGIVTTDPVLLTIVGLMTAVCHLYQALDDREADAANAITTTAVRSPGLSRGVLASLSLLLAVALRPYLGAVWALSAFMPLAIYETNTDARIGWLLTKAYFGVMWLAVLEYSRAMG